MTKNTLQIQPLSRKFLLSRGYCCGSGCRNCPYVDKHSTISQMQLSPDQNNTLAALSEWIKKTPSPYITVGGYAGTGKTTLISLLRRLIYEQSPQKRVAF